MGVVISIIVIIICALLMGVILVQNSKGGGLSAGFSSSNQLMGVKRTTDFLEKATWTLAIIVLVLSVFSAAVVRRDAGQDTEIELQDLANSQPTQAPVNFDPNQVVDPTKQPEQTP
ncbi:MAG: preprotein translocase subunit SecG [Flavobacteriales bacterium]|nr:MAG: preprotein translocase subunit SecG [Flavobacteriales bacterium]